MRAVVQRVDWARVVVENDTVGAIDKGLLVLLGVTGDDSDRDVSWMAEKIVNLRIFEDENGKMNLSLRDVGGKALVVSQFTLYGDCRKGRRPSFVKAAEPAMAERLYESFMDAVKDLGVAVERGKFGAHMKVELCNDGPVTLIVDSKEVLGQ
ncbi:D-tyrosyl-tRNA(Tyr) deacylase [Thermovirga lienii DSM 17291]|uniref:D-aminoacyl-tRNA deacylase n=1 Tax=Thermovirga lienii (strain ATCC BAA-1197 / DSM 17291 / Cas60314) TaxID=580340 RepID=G7V8R2_THELD|nr:D-aminoacyl-tRNA deacylase [Thermovirga lienii]AER66353.1 D-tyrosyl-tRNA(Tyr) deacylase [Thermovirga lienii DSM 17291]HCD72100.1 D-tyrosyl-tRNA(Tyr) deacylase [Thermovirga lienii]